MPQHRPRPLRALLAATLAVLLAGCATHGERVSPIPEPGTQAGFVDVHGAQLYAIGYLDPKAAEAAFGFDIRGAGLLPVKVVVDNQSSEEVRIDAAQTFLIDAQGQAWPLLGAEQANRRVADTVRAGETLKGTAEPGLLLGMAGALVGLAVGVVTGEDIGEAMGKGAVVGGTLGALGGGAHGYHESDSEVRRGLARQSLRRDQRIRPGELGYGFLYFPGKDEAKSAVHLRLALTLGKQHQVVRLPIAAPVTPR